MGVFNICALSDRGEIDRIRANNKYTKICTDGLMDNMNFDDVGIALVTRINNY